MPLEGRSYGKWTGVPWVEWSVIAAIVLAFALTVYFTT